MGIGALHAIYTNFDNDFWDLKDKPKEDELDYILACVPDDDKEGEEEENNG